MIEVVSNEDDLFTEPADEQEQESAQNDSDFDTLATGIAEFYFGLRNRKVPRRLSFKLTMNLFDYVMLGGLK